MVDVRNSTTDVSCRARTSSKDGDDQLPHSQRIRRSSARQYEDVWSRLRTSFLATHPFTADLCPGGLYRGHWHSLISLISVEPSQDTYLASIMDEKTDMAGRASFEQVIDEYAQEIILSEKIIEDTKTNSRHTSLIVGA